MGACYGTQSKTYLKKKISPHTNPDQYENAYEKLKIEGQQKKFLLQKALEAPQLNINENYLYQRRASRWQNEMCQSCSNLEQSTLATSTC